MKRVSLTLDADVLAEVRERVGARGVSEYVNEAVAQQLRHDALGDLLQEMREKNGPVPPEIMEEVRRQWLGSDERATRSSA